ncbi:hypothetical protein Rhe02_64330 [Rhizocola hellebori]|uniref:Uncharacterized protein n=1 Tax=Rhizocola hellebori TaxID=1392758 RepID=A0A8J3VJS9_9ACTN|nr:hypothetical protein Rhe02_64330 [Rhizocola hellebori]
MRDDLIRLQGAHPGQTRDHSRERVVGNGHDQQIGGPHGDLVGLQVSYARKETPGGRRSAGNGDHAVTCRTQGRAHDSAYPAGADDTNNHDPVLVPGVPVAISMRPRPVRLPSICAKPNGGV